MSFIERYSNFMELITDAPRAYQEACALYLISTFAGRHFIFQSIPDADIFGGSPGGGKFLNLWFILTGKSRILRKTTVVKRAIEIINILHPVLLLPDSFTPEALVTVMNSKVAGGHTRATWVNDEISGFFEELTRKDYMSATDVLLSKLYDGSSYTRHTLTRGSETIVNPYITVFFASTEYLPTLFEETTIRQGFLNRFIYIPLKKMRRMSLKTILTQKEQDEAQELLDWLQMLFERRNQKALIVVMNKQSRDIFDTFEAKIEDKISEDSLEMTEGYYGNLPNLLARISAIHRIARMTKSDLEYYRQPFLQIEKEDMEYAIEYCWKAWGWFQMIVETMRRSFRSRELFTDADEIESVYLVIRDIINDPKNPNGYARHSEALKKSRLKAERFKSMITTLINQNRVEEERVQMVNKVARRYRLKE